jgi:hypothetical protein
VARIARCLVRKLTSDIGDVPAWVLITVMTAGLVAAIWTVAGDRFVTMFNGALDGVVGGP